MSELQLKITNGEFDLFIQGDGELVYNVFKDIRSNGLGKIEKIQTEDFSECTDVKDDNKEVTEKSDKSVLLSKSKNKKKISMSNLQLIKDLDLSGNNGSLKSLKDFLSEKCPKSNVQITTVFVYYLENIMNIKNINIDHIFTCYKLMGYRIPTNLPQNLADTSSKKYGYISTKNGEYSITIIGTNFVEHDLPIGE